MHTFGLSKRAHTRAPALQTPKLHEKKTQRDKKSENGERERGKQREILGSPPTFRGPTFFWD